ncbi:hypothetical protein [Tahibacter harae]|uniref:Uncharacterized protein n=1 Tax=Tahibacter harae TaxID=2963937 RepID=A0ABT1QNS5_9GAMM|nr:hypothetical protein [Tahibacter harae]MCQ4163245.1 hypothetical protein [Tahibacter harae]
MIGADARPVSGGGAAIAMPRCAGQGDVKASACAKAVAVICDDVEKATIGRVVTWRPHHRQPKKIHETY